MSAACINLYEVRERLGGQVYEGGNRWLGPGPNHSRNDRSLSVRLDGGRPLVHSFVGDAFVDCAKHLGLERGEVRQENALEAMQRRAAAAKAKKIAEEVNRAFCKAVWDASQPIEATPAETYLWSRGLILDAEDVRFHPAVPRHKPRETDIRAPLPAMVAKVRAVSGKPQALHVTYLTPDGRKALGDRSRLMFGPTTQCAVRLAPIAAGGVLAVAEGIETAAAFTVLHGLPCWAALSTSGLQNFLAPEGVKRLVIAADRDDKTGAGMEAAKALAERARRLCDVEIHPAPEGKDWADALKEKGQ